MCRIEIREKKTHGDRFDAFGLQGAGRGKNAGFVERLELFATRRREPPLHHFTMAPLHQRPVLPRQFLHDRIVLNPLMPRDMDNVAEAFVGEHAGARAFVLQHRIGRGGGAVQHIIDLGQRDAVVAADFGDAGNDAARRIVGRGGNLVDGDVIGAQIAIHNVGEGTADIDADCLHRTRACMVPRLVPACELILAC